MVITLSAEQQAQLFEWLQPITEAHVNDSCVPSGYSLEIKVAVSWACDAMAVCGSHRLDLADVSVVVS